MRDDAKRLALRPPATRFGLIQLLQQRQAVRRQRQDQRILLARPRRQLRTLLHKPINRVPLDGEVPPRLHVLAFATGEHHRTAFARLKAGPGASDGFHDQRHRQAFAQGFQLHPRFGVRIHRDGIAGTIGAVALDTNVASQRRHGLQQPRFGAGGQRQAFFGNDVQQRLVRGLEARDFAAMRRWQSDHVVLIVFAGVRFQLHQHVVAFFLHGKLRFASHHIDGSAMSVDHVGMPGKGMDAGLARLEIAAPGLRREGGNGISILRQQMGHLRRLGGETPERHVAPFRPPAFLVLGLLPGYQRDLAVASNRQLPSQSLGRRALLALVGVGGADAVRHLLHRPQGSFPRRQRQRQIGQRGGAKGVMGRRFGSSQMGDTVNFGIALQHLIAFGNEPMEAPGRRSVAKGLQPTAAFLRLWMEVSQPAADKAVVKYVHRHAVGRTPEDAFALLHMGCALHQIQEFDDAKVLYRAFRRVQRLREHVLRLRRIDAHQRQQRERKGRCFHENMAPACAGPFQRQAFGDVLPSSRVVAAQEGVGRPRGRQRDGNGFLFQFTWRQGREGQLRIVETTLQNANKGDLSNMRRWRGSQALDKLDEGISRHHVPSDVIEATGQRPLQIALWQRAQQVFGQRLRQKAPVHSVEAAIHQLLQTIEIAAHHVAALLHLIVFDTPPHRRLEDTLGSHHESLQVALLVGNPGER